MHGFFNQQYFQTFQRFNWQSLASLFQQLEMQQPKRTTTWRLVMFHYSTFLFIHTATSCLCVFIFNFFSVSFSKSDPSTGNAEDYGIHKGIAEGYVASHHPAGPSRQIRAAEPSPPQKKTKRRRLLRKVRSGLTVHKLRFHELCFLWWGGGGVNLAAKMG